MTAHTIVDMKTELYKQTCEDWKEAISQLKEQEAYVNSLREELIKLSGGERMEHGVKIAMVTTKGRTNYKAIVEVLDPGEEFINRFTGSPETTWRITKY